MNRTAKGLLLAGLHLALVLGLGAKMRLDRTLRPRFWVRAAPLDPDLPIRGRYVALQAELPVEGLVMPEARPLPRAGAEAAPWLREERHPLRVEIQPAPNPRAVVKAQPLRDGWVKGANAFVREAERERPEGQRRIVLQDAMAFFIPEHAQDPSRLAPGEELWVEVTLPRKGPLRPIRLAVKKGGAFRVLDL